MEAKREKVEKEKIEEPKKLSKAGEWLRSGKSLITIVDMKAVLK